MNFHDRVELTIEGGVAHVLLNRPDKMNAIDDAMFNAIVEAGQHLFETSEARCVVLSGAGRSFCAGLDLVSMGQTTRHDREGSLTDRTHGNANRAQQAAVVWRKLPMPVIAAIHGVCFGGGLQIASGADIKIVAPDARLAVMEVKWGLVPDMGGYWLWRGNVRDDVLRELSYTHREFSGEEAVAYGFATHADANPLARAMALAQEIASKSPHAVRAAKGLANRVPELSADHILLEESREQHKLMGSKNQREAVLAGMEKRPGEFVDP
ncbi:MAG TPA: crotonase/enoyl-CoA hydratase family protein [Novosphingobium sp.]|nr:crotonase/enoyl-CoA hydratase family protein [Novosphingobium sp.]